MVDHAGMLDLQRKSHILGIDLELELLYLAWLQYRVLQSIQKLTVSICSWVGAVLGGNHSSTRLSASPMVFC